jgi:hypothetical protein
VNLSTQLFVQDKAEREGREKLNQILSFLVEVVVDRPQDQCDESLTLSPGYGIHFWTLCSVAILEVIVGFQKSFNLSSFFCFSSSRVADNNTRT